MLHRATQSEHPPDRARAIEDSSVKDSAATCSVALRLAEHEQMPPIEGDHTALTRNPIKSFLKKLGPGLVTGASDDDPSGIATYSQVGAQLGYGFLWTMLLTYPLMAAIQEICARIGRVTGRGIAANLRRSYPKPLLYAVLIVMGSANVFNLGADIGAMGAAVQLFLPWKTGFVTTILALGSLGAVLFVPYSTYSKYLKWLTLSLFAYVAVIFFVHIEWSQVLCGTLIPRVRFSKGEVTALVAILGTTISPYLFFWQAAQEVEEVRTKPGEEALNRDPSEATQQLERIRTDTYVGMAFSNAVAYFIILTAASTLHAQGVTDVSTAAQAAKALEPLAAHATVPYDCGRCSRGSCLSEIPKPAEVKETTAAALEEESSLSARDCPVAAILHDLRSDLFSFSRQKQVYGAVAETELTNRNVSQ
jgi:NRAMP (natural resistance-associated macrophage protein)-like metal ion transporter